MTELRRALLPERIARTLAWVGPFAAALLRTSPHAQWRGDVAAVRDLGLAATGWGGGVTTILTQVTRLLPIGSLSFRAALLSAVALAIASSALFGVALSLLRALERASEREPSAFAAPLLATASTFVAAQTPLFQAEATVGGTTMVAVAMALVLLDRGIGLVEGVRGDRPMAGIVSGAFLLGATGAENAVAGAAALLAAVVVLAVMRTSGGASRLLIPARVLGRAAFAAVLGVAIFSAPSLLRWVAPHAVFDLGGPWLWGAVLPPDVTPRPTLSSAWSDEIGWVPLALATFGAAVLAARRASRPLVAAVIALPVADVAARSVLGSTEGTLALRVLGLGALACMSTAGLYAGVTELVRRRVPFARAGSAMLVAFYGTLIALIVESASDRADRAHHAGATEFTDVALDELPPSAAVVIDSPIVAWRLIAARTVEGRRPDVLLVPTRMIDRGALASDLIASEASVEPLVRTLALEKPADEFALAHLADARPVALELPRGAGDRIDNHLTIEGPWLRFKPEPIGLTDRKGDVERSLLPMRRLIGVAAAETGDVTTRFVVASLARSHAKALLRIGDTKQATAYLAAVEAPGTNVLATGASLDVLFAGAVSRLAILQEDKPARRDTGARARAREDKRKRPPPVRPR
ncbi:MAG TPA: hypothetical protein VL400_01295 [Polyangiaceae bacterium]|nr:hypothetical protein [Polyangiaceae bacterium]